MQAIVNGRLLPVAEARISAFDRGFLYGDGLFETLRLQSGIIFRWEQHWRRLEAGLRLVHITPPFTAEDVSQWSLELMGANNCREGILRLAVSRGEGVRGYSPRDAGPATAVLSLQPRDFRDAPPTGAVRLVTSRFRVLGDDPLSGVKSASKLAYVLARAEAESRGADEALLLNHVGAVAEAAASNVFWLRDGSVFTPALSTGALPGIARAAVIELCAATGQPVHEVSALRADIDGVEAIFLTNVINGVTEVTELDGTGVSSSEVPGGLRKRFQELVERETV